MATRSPSSLVIPKEHLDGEPAVTANLETVRNGVNLGNLLIGQAPVVELEVVHDTRRCHALGQYAPSLLDAPEEKDLCRRAGLGMGDRLEDDVLAERRVRAAKGRVAGGVNPLGCVVGDELGAGVSRMELNLVDRRDDVAARVVKKSLEVLDAKVADADGLDLVSPDQFLHLAPGIDKVPVGDVLLAVVGIRATRPVHQVQVDIAGTQVLERGIDGLGHTLVVRVVKLRRQEDLLARDPGCPDALADLLLVSVREGSIDMTIASVERRFDGLADLAGLGLPSSQANGGDLGARIELESLPRTTCQ